MSLPAILAVLVLLSPFSFAVADDDTRSAYDVIQDFNFPMGILPKGVTGYDLDRSTGKWAAYFDGACSFALEGSYQLKYKSTITGTISENRLKDLTGVSVKVLFLWLNIVEVSRSGDDLDFSVGIASASFPIDNFYECPQCGCGLNCSPAPPQELKVGPDWGEAIWSDLSILSTVVVCITWEELVYPRYENNGFLYLSYHAIRHIR